MASNKKLSQQPVAPALLPGDRLPVLRRAVDEADAAKRNPTAGVEAVAAWLAPYLLTSLTCSIADAIAGRDSNDLPLGRPTVAIPGVWNGVGDSVVYLEAEETNRWAKYGQLLDAQNNWSFVVVDLDQATAVSDRVNAYTKAQSDALLAGKASAADLLTETQARQQADATLLATQQQHTQQIAQNAGWIGTLGNLATTAKTSLVAAVNELAQRAVVKYYAALGQQTDGALTVKAATDALAGKLDVAAAWPDLSNETQIYAAYPNNKILSGFASVFDGDVSAALPESNDPFTKVAGLMYWRALSATTITFTKGKVDGATMLALAAGEWVFLLGQGGRSAADAIWYVRLRGSGNPAAGIDYTKPVTLNQAATLQANKAYTATGTGYTLTLPDPAANIGALLFVLIDKNATGFYPLAGTAYSLYARESLTLRASVNGWTKTGGELLPLGARIETSLSQQDAVGQNDFWRVPLSQLVRASVPALVNLPDNSLVVQRDCPNATLNVFVALKNAVTNGYYVAFVRVTTPSGVVSYPVQSTVAVDRTGTGFLSQAFSLAVVAGTTLQLYFYNLDPANLRGQFDGSQCSLTYTETV